MNHTHCFKNTHHINLSTLPHPIDHTWEVTLRLPSWLFAFFRISRGLYIGLKLWLCTYQPGDDRNQLNLQAQFFCQGLGSLSLLNNLLEAGRLVLVWFWPNTEENLQGVIHLPTGSTLETVHQTHPLTSCKSHWLITTSHLHHHNSKHLKLQHKLPPYHQVPMKQLFNQNQKKKHHNCQVTTGNQLDHTKGPEFYWPQPTGFWWTDLLRSTRCRSRAPLPKPTLVWRRVYFSKLTTIIVRISWRHLPGWGRGGRGTGTGRGGRDYLPEDKIPPPYPGRENLGGDINTDRWWLQLFITGAIRELAHQRNDGRNMAPGDQQNPNAGGVEPLDWNEAPGHFPGKPQPDPLRVNAEQVCHNKILFQGVVETRSALLDSYFLLISIIALLHLLAYIWFL